MPNKILGPAELKAKMLELRLSQSALAIGVETTQTQLNRYLHEHLNALPIKTLERISFVIEECEFLTKIFQPIKINLYDGDALLETLGFLHQYWVELQERDLENYNPFLTMYPEPILPEIQSL